MQAGQAAGQAQEVPGSQPGAWASAVQSRRLTHTAWSVQPACWHAGGAGGRRGAAAAALLPGGPGRAEAAEGRTRELLAGNAELQARAQEEYASRQAVTARLADLEVCMHCLHLRGRQQLAGAWFGIVCAVR